MYKIISGTIVVLGLAGASFAAAGTASAADVGVSLNLGDVAFGYQDGYWDHSHQWHNWRNQDEARITINARRATNIMTGSTTVTPTRAGTSRTQSGVARRPRAGLLRAPLRKFRNGNRRADA